MVRGIASEKMKLDAKIAKDNDHFWPRPQTPRLNHPPATSVACGSPNHVNPWSLFQPWSPAVNFLKSCPVTLSLRMVRSQSTYFPTWQIAKWHLKNWCQDFVLPHRCQHTKKQCYPPRGFGETSENWPVPVCRCRSLFYLPNFLVSSSKPSI